MRLHEIQKSAADHRVERLKANAKATLDTANKMKAHADLNAAQANARSSQDQFKQLRRPASKPTIKPFS